MALRLEQRAAELREHAQDLINRAHQMQWVSTAAEGYRHTVAGDRTKLNHCAEQLDSAAAKLRAHAQTVRERIAEIRRIEQAVTHFFVHAVTSLPGAVLHAAGSVVDAVGGLFHGDLPDPPWHDWPFRPDNLPAPDSIEWLRAGEFFRGQGIL